eukprot:1578974-Pleurochrysis_carterae.AAC.1
MCQDYDYKRRKDVGPPPPDRFEISSMLWLESWVHQVRAASNKKEPRLLRLTAAPMPAEVLYSNMDRFLQQKFGRARLEGQSVQKAQSRSGDVTTHFTYYISDCAIFQDLFIPSFAASLPGSTQ